MKPARTAISVHGSGSFDAEVSSSFYGIWDRNSDKLEIGGKEVANVSFSMDSVEESPGHKYFLFSEGYLIKTDKQASVLGVGPDNSSTSSSFPYQLVENSLINSPGLSIWKNPKNNEAEILLGGLNKAKYNSPLQAYKIQENPPALTLPFTDITIDFENGTTASYELGNEQFLIYSGYLTRLPRSTALQIYEDLGLRYDYDIFTPTIPCPALDDNRTMTFTMGNITLTSPWTSFLVGELGEEREEGGDCFFTMTPMERDPEVSWAGEIGLKFLKDVDLALDYGGMMAGIAPVRDGPGHDEVLEFVPGARMPDATGEFPESLTVYPSPTSGGEDGTSTGLAMRTAIPGSLVAGAMVLAML